jgi:DNA-binding GntR family transcriptional regulator
MPALAAMDHGKISAELSPLAVPPGKHALLGGARAITKSPSAKPTREDVEDCYGIASALEGLAARLAVERAQAEEIAHLRELHQLLKEACQKRDLARYFDLNSRFHRFIAEIARNERLYRLIDQLRQEIQRTRILSLHLPERLDYSMREHDQILDAFLKKNPQLAESTVVRHLNNQMETLKRALAR